MCLGDTCSRRDNLGRRLVIRLALAFPGFIQGMKLKIPRCRPEACPESWRLPDGPSGNPLTPLMMKPRGNTQVSAGQSLFTTLTRLGASVCHWQGCAQACLWVGSLGVIPPPRPHASSFNLPRGKGSNNHNPPPRDITTTQTWTKNAAILGDSASSKGSGPASL